MKFSADNFDAWKALAIEADREAGHDVWRREDASPLYDHAVIRRRLEELKKLREAGKTGPLISYMNEGLHGNMGGMGTPGLYRHANFGTKDLISDYTQELILALQELSEANASAYRHEDKLSFFRRLLRGYGRGGLMLSGAGSLGPFHLGAAKSLWEQNLLPEIISGASAGAIVAAILCTHDDLELNDILQHERLNETFRLVTNDQSGALRGKISIDHLRGLIETWIPDLTFAEAHAISGRHLNVTVAPAELHQQSRTLNPVISPNVLIREAVLASSAIPGLFAPVKLAARSEDGTSQPYVASRRWVDGSITDDLPVRRLARVYGCNFFIASQVNPFVLWSLQDPHSQNPWTQMMDMYRAGYQQMARNVYPYAMRAVRGLYPYNVWTRQWYGVATQDYTADVNIMPASKFVDPSLFLSVVSSEEASALVREGERATWPRLERIRICTSVGKTLADIVTRQKMAGGSNAVAA